MRGWLGLVAVLLVAGAAWGATQPLAKIAVSEGYRHFGLLFWQLTLGFAFLAPVTLLRGKSMPTAGGDLRLYLVIALAGSVLPGIASYSAAVHLPSGVLSILLSSVPMFAFPIALLLGNDTFRWRRLVGLSLGLIGVALLVLPGQALPSAAQSVWIPVALIASLLYAFEGNYVARWGTGGLDPVQVLCGASLLGALITLPLALVSGQFINPLKPWGAPDYALLASSFVHVVAYTLYVGLVGRAGSVFAAQVSYFVTLFGVIWAMVFLAERYSGYVWAAFGIMMLGLFFVQPRWRSALGNSASVAQDTAKTGSP